MTCCVTQADAAFCTGTKPLVAAGNQINTGVLLDVVYEAFTGQVGTPHIEEGNKGGFLLICADSGHGIETVMDVITTALQMGNEGIHPVLGFVKGCHHSDLGQAGHAADCIFHTGDVRNFLKHVRIGANQIAAPDTCHGEAFGVSVHGQNLSGLLCRELHQAEEFLFAVDDVRPDFVVEDVQIVGIGNAKDFFQFFFGIEDAQRVVRITQTEQFCFWYQMTLRTLQVL